MENYEALVHAGFEGKPDAKRADVLAWLIRRNGLEMSRISGFIDRARGTGRPTKKDRRAIDAFVDPAMFGWDDDDEMFDDED